MGCCWTHLPHEALVSGIVVFCFERDFQKGEEDGDDNARFQTLSEADEEN
jgi:hypothetical protein